MYETKNLHFSMRSPFWGDCDHFEPNHGHILPWIINTWMQQAQAPTTMTGLRRGHSSISQVWFSCLIIPARDTKQCAGAKGYQTIGGDDDDDDDDDDDTQMRAQRRRHMRAHESRHIRAHIWQHTYESRHMRGQIWEQLGGHIWEHKWREQNRSTHMGAHRRAHIWEHIGGDSVLCEPAQSKRTWTFHKSHFVWKFAGKMPHASPTTSIKHRALTLTVRTPSVWPHCLGKNGG